MIRLVLSPHLDDAVLSLGGSIHAWSSAGDDVLVVTVFAGDDPHAGHRRSDDLVVRQLRIWGLDDYGLRRAEDVMALTVLGARVVHLDLPERLLRHLGPGSLDGVLACHEPAKAVDDLRSRVGASLAPQLSACDYDYLYSPAGLAPHPDHRMLAQVVASLWPNAIQYEEMPYCLTDAPPFHRSCFGPDSLRGKLEAIGAYQSQVGVLFGDIDKASALVSERAAYLKSGGRFAEGLVSSHTGVIGAGR